MGGREEYSLMIGLGGIGNKNMYINCTTVYEDLFQVKKKEKQIAVDKLIKIKPT